MRRAVPAVNCMNLVKLSVLWFPGHKFGPMLLEFALNLGQNLRMLLGDIDLLAGIASQIEQQRWVVLLEFHRVTRRRIAGGRLKMGFESAFANGEQLIPTIINDRIARGLPRAEENR